MNDERVMVEDILGEFGFRLRWTTSETCAQVQAYEIVARQEPDRQACFYRQDWPLSMPVYATNIDEAAPYLDGFIKWDGCSQFDLAPLHFDGPEDFKLHAALLKHLWHQAFALMGRLPDDAWEEWTSEKPSKPGH